jgi:hypothetical protein
MEGRARAPTDAETTYWVNRLNTTSLASVASDIVNSTKSYRLIAINDFQTYLCERQRFRSARPVKPQEPKQPRHLGVRL